MKQNRPDIDGILARSPWGRSERPPSARWLSVAMIAAIVALWASVAASGLLL